MHPQRFLRRVFILFLVFPSRLRHGHSLITTQLLVFIILKVCRFRNVLTKLIFLSFPVAHPSLASYFKGAVGRFWRAEVLGSSVTPGVGKKKRRGKGVGDDHSSKRLGTLSKSDLGKMLRANHSNSRSRARSKSSPQLSNRRQPYTHSHFSCRWVPTDRRRALMVSCGRACCQQQPLQPTIGRR